MMPRTEQAQTHMDDNNLEDADLLALLRTEAEEKAKLTEARLALKNGQGKTTKEAQEAVDEHLRGKGLEPDTTYRCGPFEITVATRGGTHVEFDTEKKVVYNRKMIAAD